MSSNEGKLCILCEEFTHTEVKTILVVLVFLFLVILRYEMKLGVAYSPLTIEAHTTDQSHGDSAAVKVCVQIH